MADPAQISSEPVPAIRPSGIPRMSRLPVLKPTSSNTNPNSNSQLRILRPITSASKLSTSSRVDRPAPARRLPAATARLNQSRDAGSRAGIDDMFKKPTARPLSRQTREDAEAMNNAGSTNVDGHGSTTEPLYNASNTETATPHSTAPDAGRRKGPRQSLAERTIDSLASVPASPKVRRRSSFFSPQSPMANSRPSSSLAVHGRHHSLEEQLRSPGTVRMPSPSKAKLGNGTSSSVTMKQNEQARLGASRTVGASRTPRPKPVLEGIFAKPPPSSGLNRPKQDSGQQASKPPKQSSATPRNVSNSSASFREQIRLAKQSHRNSPKHENSNVDFDLVTDPFNTKPKGAVSSLMKCVDEARLRGRLNISGLGLKQVPDEVLTMYEFNDDDAENVNWSEFVDLQKVIAADNDFENLPDELFPNGHDEDRVPQWAGLETLDLHGNFLSCVNLGLSKLRMLTVLNLSRNRLTNPAFETLSQIQSLRELRIAENIFVGELPQSISQLDKLEVLELQSNKFTSISPAIRQLRNLRILNVASNHLHSLPLEELEAVPLVELAASKNLLSGPLFSAPAARLAKLQVLDVSFNDLTALAIDNLSLPLVRIVNVSSNRLTTLPAMTSWSSITTLVAEDNALTHVPPGFTELQSLKSANFTGNDIRKLSPEIGAMTGLDSLNISGNPLGESRFVSMNTEELKKILKGRLAPPA